MNLTDCVEVEGCTAVSLYLLDIVTYLDI